MDGAFWARTHFIRAPPSRGNCSSVAGPQHYAPRRQRRPPRFVGKDETRAPDVRARYVREARPSLRLRVARWILYVK